jgi:hypothetical protein
MEASEMERESSVSPAEAEIELSGEAAQEILEIESQVRDITIIPPCIVRSMPFNSIRRI